MFFDWLRGVWLDDLLAFVVLFAEWLNKVLAGPVLTGTLLVCNSLDFVVLLGECLGGALLPIEFLAVLSGDWSGGAVLLGCWLAGTVVFGDWLNGAFFDGECLSGALFVCV